MNDTQPAAAMKRSAHLVFTVALAAALLFTQAAHAGPLDPLAPLAPLDPLLPRAADVSAALRETPAVRAAESLVVAEQAVRRQFEIGPHEWTATATAARRNQLRPTPENTVEWELGIEHAVRLPGKAAAHASAGSLRVELAQAALRKVWAEQARMLLERHAAWLREREAERIWRAQATLLRLQVQAVGKRHRLGDAARVEEQQAEAAAAQAEAQLHASAGRALQARESLRRLFPGLNLMPPDALPEPEPASPDSDDAALKAQLSHSPELAAAQAEAALAQSQLRVETADRRPDPTVGLRVGRARSGAEQTVGLMLSLPFGGDYRAAGAAASAARAEATQLQQAEVQRRVEMEASQRLRDTQATFKSWERNADAAARLLQVADSLQRGYGLGEGSLAELLAARRLAHEQQLTAAQGRVDAWLARQRLQLEAGVLWGAPPR